MDRRRPPFWGWCPSDSVVGNLAQFVVQHRNTTATDFENLRILLAQAEVWTCHAINERDKAQANALQSGSEARAAFEAARKASLKGPPRPRWSDAPPPPTPHSWEEGEQEDVLSEGAAASSDGEAPEDVRSETSENVAPVPVTPPSSRTAEPPSAPSSRARPPA